MIREAADVAEFDDRIALITGPAKGTGEAVTLGFAEGGADLVLVGRDVAAIEPPTPLPPRSI